MLLKVFWQYTEEQNEIKPDLSCLANSKMQTFLINHGEIQTIVLFSINSQNSNGFKKISQH